MVISVAVNKIEGWESYINLVGHLAKIPIYFSGAPGGARLGMASKNETYNNSSRTNVETQSVPFRHRPGTITHR